MVAWTVGTNDNSAARASARDVKANRSLSHSATSRVEFALWPQAREEFSHSMRATGRTRLVIAVNRPARQVVRSA